MDIDTGDSPPVSSRPYTLALKHHKWVQEEIEILERAGIITKSMSPWASPIVIVPKKSQSWEPPKKRWSGENGWPVGLYGTYVPSPGTSSSPLSKGDIIGSTGISLFCLICNVCW